MSKNEGRRNNHYGKQTIKRKPPNPLYKDGFAGKPYGINENKANLGYFNKRNMCKS